jgi:hypothetical protein
VLLIMNVAQKFERVWMDIFCGIDISTIKATRVLESRPWSVADRPPGGRVSHPVLEGKPNANHVCARISNSRTHQLHNMDIITQCSNSIKKGNNSRLHHMSETST